MNYYLVNLSIADLMITAWGPMNSLVKELSDRTEYVMPALACKVGGFYTGGCAAMPRYSISILHSAVHGVQYPHSLSHLL